MGKKFKNKDLASKLGVSGTLVSLVLNNKADLHGIRKETQEKVLILARQMGYFSSLAEKNVVSPVEETPGIIGMLVPALNDPFVTGIAPYLQKAFASIGFGFSVVSKDPDDQRFERMTVAFRKFFSGLILLGEAADENTIRNLRSAEYPFILLEKSYRTGRLNSVNTDITAGAQMVAHHIQNLDYKNIIIAASHRSAGINQSIINEVEEALNRIPGINKPVFIEFDNSSNENEPDFEQFETFLRPPFRADIIITVNAHLVYPIMGLLRKRKLRVPQDIALISLEEGAGFDLMLSPVTCLRKPLPSIATKVASMIWSEIKNTGKGKFKRQVNVIPELVIRNSCGTL